MKDLDDAMQCHKDILLLLPSGDPHRPITLVNLAICFQDRFLKGGGDMEDLQQAIQFLRDSLSLCPPDHSDRSASLHNLGISLTNRYLALGALDDLEESIQCKRDALSLCAPNHPDNASISSSLATSLDYRFHMYGQLQDLDEAIQCCRSALEGHLFNNVDRAGYLGSLASCLRTRFNRLRNSRDLEEAIECVRDELNIYPPGHPNIDSSLTTLANCLHDSYDHKGDPKYLEESIQCYRDVLLLQCSGNPSRWLTLSHLARCLVHHYEKDGTIQHLEEAIKCNQEALSLCPSGHPERGSLLTLRAQFLHIKSHNAEEITSLFEMATDHKPAHAKSRLDSALSWIRKAKGDSLVRAFERALNLADQYLLIRSSISSRHRLLPSIPFTLAPDAAAVAIAAGDVKKAVEFLEQGRSLLWSQMGRYRTSIQALQDVDPGLAEEFGKLSAQLEASAIPQMSEMPHLSMEDEDRKYRQVNDAWMEVIEKIRKLQNFGNFLLPPSFNDLRKAAEQGPVIVINLNVERCDAIIIRQSDDPLLVPLSFQAEESVRLWDSFTTALRSEEPSKKITGVLRCLWDDIVEPIVRKLQEIGIAQGSRIWWCPTSFLTTLPLHAAGPYRKNKDNLPDIYISSYTPTLSALVRSFQTNQFSQATPDKSSTDPRLLVVAQPNAPGQVDIPSVRKELQVLQRVVPSIDILLEENGTRAAVLAGLQTHSWVHLMSHGSKDVEDPLKSSFHLYDTSLDLIDIIQARLDNAEYAFLAACHSAAAYLDRPDETLHLAASLQFAGFKSVIGTMYAMADEDGPMLAQEVYKFMFRDVERGEGQSRGVVRYTDAAKALNLATKALRENNVPVERWINFVHIGS
ncbi:hypothetical protein FRC02_011636 [Tulasnella sp. 418]|nr:hypothetical protein FRC02_011636 [Tulasnella sp. 418]